MAELTPGATGTRAVRAELGPSTAQPGDEALLVDRLIGAGPAVVGGPAVAETPAAADAPAGDVRVDGERRRFRLVPLGNGRHDLVDDDTDGPARRVLLDGPVRTDRDGRREREVVVDGWRFAVVVEDARRAALRTRARRDDGPGSHAGPTEVRAIIPGRIVSVDVAPGDPVTAGRRLAVVEAMKMQNELRAPRDGTIGAVAVSAGGTVEVGDLLMRIE